MAVCIEERAHAKVNLNLIIRGRRADGYHQLSSLVAFATDIFDVLTLDPDQDFDLEVSGPFAKGLQGQGNLVEKAWRLAEGQLPSLQVGRFHLEKNIPLASGVGGGSADAAAALRAIASRNDLDGGAGAFLGIAPSIGADVPVCLSGEGRQAAFMQGIGDEIYRPKCRSYLPDPDVFAVLVNPGVEVSTAQVFMKLGAPLLVGDGMITPPRPFADRAELISYLDATPNDMQPAAIAIAPIIGDVLGQLARTQKCLLARMSGSGATCFGLFATASDAEDAMRSLQSKHPAWWVATTRLA
ncbi:MAG: 4-(cytidine 5'-diphospho)-2-C-methyl-D-erythritol kinase [Pseudomonadota bacterium]